MPVLHASHASPPMPDEPRDWNEAVPGKGFVNNEDALARYAALPTAELHLLADRYDALAAEARAASVGAFETFGETRDFRVFDPWLAAGRAARLASLCRAVAAVRARGVFGAEALRHVLTKPALRRRAALATHLGPSIPEHELTLGRVCTEVDAAEGVGVGTTQRMFNRYLPGDGRTPVSGFIDRLRVVAWFYYVMDSGALLPMDLPPPE
jgi:hypothetical protein